ncbi:MAG: HAD family hydrolase [Elainellaceae cyanobacterium]
MVLKVVLFDFNGVIINDEPLHQMLIEEVLIQENLRPKSGEFRDVCLGRSDRACLKELFHRRGRVVTDDYLNELVDRKSRAYRQKLDTLEKLPIYLGLDDFIFQLRTAHILMGLVSGAVRSEIEQVLNRAKLRSHFSVIVSGDEAIASKPEPDGYLLAVERLNQHHAELNLKPENCLAIEDTPAGIRAAKRAGMSVVGVANTYPYHMMQRQANWAVDYLSELELDRIRRLYECKSDRQPVA